MEPLIKRRGPDPRMNLSSNELIHPSVAGLFSEVGAAITTELLSRYPATERAASRIAAHFELEPDEVLLTPGSDAALRRICDLFAERHPGGILLLQHPNYAACEQAASRRGLQIRRVAFELGDPAAQERRLIEAARAGRGWLIAVSVPNGPVGGVMSDDHLDELAAAATERGHLLVIDACYQAFHGPLTAMTERRSDHVLVVQSMSKSHALAGARVAILTGSRRVVAGLELGPLEHSVAAPSLLAAELAADQAGAFRAIWAEIARVRGSVVDQLSRLGVRAIASGGNFVTCCLGTAAAAGDVTAALSRAGYRVRDLSDLAGLGGCVRFTIADESTTASFMRALGASLAPQRALRDASHEVK